jgi:hypothetical protein
MATNNQILSKLSNRWNGSGLFDSDWANLVAGWCVEHFSKYGYPPESALLSRFERWADEEAQSEEVIKAVERFLQSLDDDCEQLTKDHLLDLSVRYFNRVKLREEINVINSELDQGYVAEAWDRVDRLRKFDFDSDGFISPSSDSSVWYRPFETNKRRPLIHYLGDIGKYFGQAFCRKEFYAFMGPDKNGKTSYLIDLLHRAIWFRNRVAYFDAGDSDEDEIILRLACRTLGLPEFKQQCRMPVSWNGNEPKFEEIDLPAVEPDQAFDRFRRVAKYRDTLRISCHPNSTLTVADIEAKLEDWSSDDWQTDVVVIDYADILAPPRGIKDPLDQIDEVWKSLRRLSQRKDCLVVTATQSNSAAYTKGGSKLLSRSNFSGRKTKLAHVNGMIGINVSSDDRTKHSAKLNWVVRRKWKGPATLAFCQVAGCYDVEQPIIISKF